MDLPKIYPITPATTVLEELLTSINKLNISVFQYRRKSLDESKVKEELDLLESLSSTSSISVIINSYHQENLLAPFSGLHLTGNHLNEATSRQIDKNRFFGISCHDENDIKKAESLDADYIFLSPVNTTSSHKNQISLGWKRFSELSEGTKLPVYALGGLSKQDLLKAEKSGAYGVAGISRFWSC